jgi:HK97 family phage major capsid protein
MSDFEQKHLEALNALRDETKKLSPEQEAKINSLLDAQETKNQAKLKEIQEKANKTEQLENRLNSIEADFKRGLSGEEKKAKTQELKAFETYLVKGNAIFTEGQAEAKYLRTDNNPQGGYLAPAEYIAEIIKNITEISPVRQVARVIPTSRKSITIPKETGLPSFTWLGEGESISGSQAEYGSEELFVNKGGIKIQITQEMIDDSLFDMRSEISLMTALKIAEGEGTAFILGSGVKQPQGLLTNPKVAAYASGAASTLTGDCLFGVQGEIKGGYNLSWMLNRKTLHQQIRTLKDTYGQYLLQLGLGSLPNTIAGLPYVLAKDMPDVAAGTYPILLGDYRRAYVIVDNRQIRFKEDTSSGAGTDSLIFYVYKRTGGQVVQPEAIKKIKIGTSV